MTKDLNATIQQHQPLRVPSGWDKQEKAFIVQLEEILDDIYRRFGRLKLSDMGKQIQEGITFIDDETGERKMISEAVSAVNLKVQDNTNSIAEVNITTQRIETRISELGYGNTFMQPDEPENYTEGDIWIQTLAVGTWDGIKTDYASWQEIKNTVSTWQVVGGIPKVFAWDGHGWVQLYDAVISMSLQTEIEQLADQIALRATTAQLDILSGQVSQYASELVVMAQQIQSAVTAVNAKPSTYVSLSDPTLTNNVHLGDQWIKHDNYIASWNAIKGHYSSWSEFKDTHDRWADGLGDRTYIWDGTQWIETGDRATEVVNQTKITETATQISLLATQQASLSGQIIETRAEISVTATEIKQYVANNYYGLVSGVSIVAAGVEISGGKYVKIKSGAKFLVDSGNFSIDESGNVVMTGTVYASGGTFSGTLVAATGTFAGSLSAATGTFAGSLSAATGTFAGTLSAACVTSGTMSAERIKGGTLTLGGDNNTSGSLLIKNASGTQIGKWDKDGISAIAGTIGGWTLAANLLSSGSGSGYVALDSKATDTYAIWAGNATAGSAPFRVTRAGVLTASGATISGTITSTNGTIGGWTLAANLLSSGSGTSYVALNSKSSDTYAMWVGAESAASAPWRVSRDGTHTITKLVITGENGSDTVINPKTYSMWKLYYHVIKSVTVSGGYVTSMTLSNGDTVNFNSASAVTLGGSWSSGRYSAVAYDGSGRVVATKQSGAVHADTTEANIRNDLAGSSHASAISALADGVELFTMYIDGTGAYKAGNNDARSGQTVVGTVYTIIAHSGDWVKVQEVGTGYSRVPYMS